MAEAKCNRCLGSATGKTFEEASSKINHAVGLSRGIKCGDNYNSVVEVKEGFTKQSPKTVETTYSKVEGKTGDTVVFDEAKYTKSKKSKKQS